MIIGSIIKNAIKILATNPAARKKAGEVAYKAYNKARPIIKKTSKTLYYKLELKSNTILIHIPDKEFSGSSSLLRIGKL